MRISISNLAWNREEDEDISGVLKSLSIDAIDVAPGKYFPDPALASKEEIERVKNWWGERGISIIGMQSLMFGTSGLNMFSDEKIQALMLRHLSQISRIGSILGADKLVFGSPKNRDRASLSDEKAQESAVSFFRRLGEIAEGYGVTFCLEANPACYGSNFMTTSAETAQMVKDVSNSSILMQLDSGAVAINSEDPVQIAKNFRGLIGHVHLSEPDLVTLGEGKADHGAFSSALKAYLPDKAVTVEMLRQKNEPALSAVKKALMVAKKYYL
ncbi:MAG: sugar phosphate isomerase/epimerase [Ignavibacteria bacterium]|jgi:sugar phosphate isomerase/epimerase|nr:sugar phosphate isomerase/epimerase [Ignavibacteria bacterium]MCU7502679.1 sugar phosphate isomerase/epimerase [Ignavibacteria bacterium]MCU7515118.1 sugar phosphate isomerase/epimerase [Ignavibacteria bacterium]